MWEVLRRLIRPAELIDLPTPPPFPDREDQRARLRLLTAEALIRSDEGAVLLRQIRARRSLGEIAPRGGPLVRRFFAMRDELPTNCTHPRDDQLRARLDSILHHHAMLISLAMDLLAFEWRSPRLAIQLDALDGMGAPATWLEELYAELAVDAVSEPIRDTISS